MTDYAGVYVIRDTLAAIAAADTLLELTAATDTGVDLLRAWVSPRGAVLDQIQEINVFTNDAAGTGTSQTPVALKPGYAAFGGTARDVITVEGATPTDIVEDGFHFQNGWLYLPLPEERIRIAGGDIMGIRFPVAPDAAMNIACGMIFGELA
jgi:hypothetical protein